MCVFARLYWRRRTVLFADRNATSHSRTNDKPDAKSKCVADQEPNGESHEKPDEKSECEPDGEPNEQPHRKSDEKSEREPHSESDIGSDKESDGHSDHQPGDGNPNEQPVRDAHEGVFVLFGGCWTNTRARCLCFLCFFSM